mmetsp:Transcript_30703/g.86802  ORF Transcript_30703/g.86802 Transcript_30703/m.86802 type:complete len:569 (+) Transcript_30703:274-1980(+)
MLRGALHMLKLKLPTAARSIAGGPAAIVAPPCRSFMGTVMHCRLLTAGLGTMPTARTMVLRHRPLPATRRLLPTAALHLSPARHMPGNTSHISISLRQCPKGRLPAAGHSRSMVGLRGLSHGRGTESEERQRACQAGARTTGAAEWASATDSSAGSNQALGGDVPLTVSDHGALHAINIAIAANFVIFLSKLGVYFASGSSAMLAEAIHSIADVVNQGLLRTGVMKSLQGPTASHPYGYSRDRFVWSLISAVGIFCLGAGVSIVHGINSLMHEYTVENLGWGLLVLCISLLLEGYSLTVALRTVMKTAQRRGITLLDYLRRGDDPTTNAIVMEDAGAVAGLLIAGACTIATHITGNCAYDALGSIAVGTLLGFIAVFLIQRNRQLLIGRSMSPKVMEKLMEHLRADPVVKAVYDAKSEEIGMGIYRFKAEIDFCGETLVARYLERSGHSILQDKIRAAANAEDTHVLDLVLRQYGKEVVQALATEVDRIEMELREIEPGLKHLDLEADRRPPLSLKQLIGQMPQATTGESSSNNPLTSGSVDFWNFAKTSVDGSEVMEGNGKAPSQPK